MSFSSPDPDSEPAGCVIRPAFGSERGRIKNGAFPPSDVDALARAAGEQLAQGDAQTAFELADRRCRLIIPSARDLFLRSQTHKAAGRIDAAQRDLAAATALDPTDALIDRAALAWGDKDARVAAAERVLTRAADWPLRRQAAAVWFDGGARTAHRLRRSAEGLAGWLAWASLEPLQIEATGGGETHTFLVEPDPDHPLATPERSAADVAIELPDDGSLALTLHAGSATERVWLPGAARPRRQTIAPRAPSAAPTPFVTVIVPVFEDYEATRACLNSLQRARPAIAHRIVVVDDASPNAALRAWLDEAAGRRDFELMRNAVNQGFAAAVNRALATREHGDALLLNADALLPAGAIDRLYALSRSPDIGAVTPFSNNGELTSWPVRNDVNPMPSAAEIEALDARARAANGDALVDIPNGVGFCLYITHACLDAVGGLPELYAQGYYEDVEFCLAARERGFRNVAAAGVFVGHAGSRSFGARKKALVARNLTLAEARFPGYRLETAAFVSLDPLKPYRAALDAVSPPSGPVVVVACGAGAAAASGRRRAATLKVEGDKATVLTLTASARGRSVAFKAVGGGAPQSLSFDFAQGETQAFADYVSRLDLIRIEWFDPASLPEEALTALVACGAPGDLYCGDLAWFSITAPPRVGPCLAEPGAEPCEICRGRAAAPAEDTGEPAQRRFRLGRVLERVDHIVPLDGLAESFALRVFKARVARLEPAPATATARRGGGITRVAALYPFASATCDRLLLRIGQRLAARAQAAELVVFGAAMDDAALMATAKVFVAGPVAPEDYVALARDYGVDALLAPGRGGGYGDLEETAAALGAPKAYFDWSFGAFPVEWGDLSLDPRICEDKAAAEIVAWIEGSA